MNQNYSEDFAARAFTKKVNGKVLNSKQQIEMEDARILSELSQLKADFLARQEARACSAT